MTALEQRIAALEQRHREEIDLYRRIQINDEEQIVYLFEQLARIRDYLNLPPS